MLKPSFHKPWMNPSLHLAVLIGFTMLSLFLLWPITGGDYPPGVDTPTFLHLSWVAESAFSGNLEDPLKDPYWYGGFFYLVYPPLGYALVGLLSAATGAYFVDVYLALLILSYGFLAYSAWFLARTLHLQWWSAILAGLLTALAYPSLNAVFLWGWYTSLVALPFGILSIAWLERAKQGNSWRAAVLAGLFMALATYGHHMTSFSISIGLTAWLIYHLAFERESRRQLVLLCGIAAATAVVTTLPWAIPFLVEATETGFRREIPGNWEFPVFGYWTNILDPSLIGAFIFPSFLGIVLSSLTILGGILSFTEVRRFGGITVLVLALAWFSMGANANPLINFYPFSSLDVARFHLFMVPLMALLSAFAVETVAAMVFRSNHRFSISQVRLAAILAIVVLVIGYPSYNAIKARNLAEPYVVEAPVQQALDWLATAPSDVTGDAPKIYGVGLWNWHSFLVPTLAERRIIDGWHDEGAANVEMIRQLRKMAWIGGDPVDPEIAHEILTTLGADYVLMHRSFWLGERTIEYWTQFELRPDLFQLQGRWGDLGVFQVLNQSG